MTETKTSLYSGLAVFAAAISVVAGITIRDRVDGGYRVAAQGAPTKVASLTDEVPEGDYFDSMVRLLKREFVEPIKEDEKLAIGAVRGMISSLADAKSLFLDPEEYRAYQNAKDGIYEGVGVELVFTYDKPLPKSDGGLLDPEQRIANPDFRIPRLTVAAVTPGGPADKAGVKVGDWVDSVDGYWVIDGGLVRRFQQAQRDVASGKAPASSLIPLRRELRAKSEKSLSPVKARDRLVLGKNGKISVTWHRGEKTFETDMEKSVSRMWPLAQTGAFRLTFNEDSADRLREAIAGKSELTIDLRNNLLGDYDEMIAALQVVAPKGEYGEIYTFRERDPQPIKVQTGNANPPKLTLLVDQTTRGAAEIFAMALQKKGLATLEGGPMAGDTAVVRDFPLPDGSGYTLVTGRYEAEPIAAEKRVARRAEPYKPDVYGKVAFRNAGEPQTTVASRSRAEAAQERGA